MFLTIALSVFLLHGHANDTEDDAAIDTQIELTCSKIEEQKSCPDIHRSPLRIPQVYLDSTNKLLHFTTACYDTQVLIINPIDLSTEFTTTMDGETEVQLPMNISGQYELRIIRGNYCFWGIVEL